MATSLKLLEKKNSDKTNILGYIKWRGDLEFWQSPLNEVDNLMLCYLTYVQMEEVWRNEPRKVLRLEEVIDRYFDYVEEGILPVDTTFTKDSPNVMRAMAGSRRFREIRIRNFVNEIDVSKNLQFSAMEFLLPDGTIYVAFRGTDDRIVGWKEDFLLSGFEVEAQKRAVEYLNRVAEEDPERKLHVGGHSKGGHLAVYAAAYCKESVKSRILDVYNNDGPGFLKEFIASEELQSILPRVTRIVPQSSIVGLLLEHAGEPVVVESNDKGVGQHDPMTWMVEGPAFVKREKLDEQALLVEKSLKEWIDGFNEEEKKAFIRDLFSVIEEPGVETLTEVHEGGIKNFQMMVRKLNTLPPETKKKIGKVFEVYFSNWMSGIGGDRKLLKGVREHSVLEGLLQQD